MNRPPSLREGRPPSTYRNNILFITGIQILIPLAIAFVWVVGGVLNGTERDSRVAWLLGAVVAGGASLLVVAHRHRQARRAALAATMNQLARGLDGGRSRAGAELSREWTAAHWPAESSLDDVYFGAVAHQTAGGMQGFPVLVEVEPDGATGEDGIPPRVLIYLAAPGVERPPLEGSAHRLVQRLEGAGFQLEFVAAAGILARASRSLVKAFRKDVSGLVNLSPIIRQLARLATSVVDTGALTPLPALPEAAAAFFQRGHVEERSGWGAWAPWKKGLLVATVVGLAVAAYLDR